MKTRFATLTSLAFLFVAGHPSNADTLTNAQSNEVHGRMRHAGYACNSNDHMGWACKDELDMAGIKVQSAIQRNLYLIQK